MSTIAAPVGRAATAVVKQWRGFAESRLSKSPEDFAIEFATTALTAALDDPDMGPRISTWRRPCGHSRVINAGQVWWGEAPEYEQGCSPCVRDRMRAYFLGESTIIDDIIDDGRNKP